MNGMKKKLKGLIVILVLVLSLMPMCTLTAYAAEIGTAVNLPVSPSSGKVYFGAWDASWSNPAPQKPMLWRIVAKDSNTITLFCVYNKRTCLTQKEVIN